MSKNTLMVLKDGTKYNLSLKMQFRSPSLPSKLVETLQPVKPCIASLDATPKLWEHLFPWSLEKMVKSVGYGTPPTGFFACLFNSFMFFLGVIPT